MKDAFDCSVCGHLNTDHTKQVWPLFTKLCSKCDCAGYHPLYKARMEGGPHSGIRP